MSQRILITETLCVMSLCNNYPAAGGSQTEKAEDAAPVLASPGSQRAGHVPRESQALVVLFNVLSSKGV